MFHKINRMKEKTEYEMKHVPLIECKDSTKPDEFFNVRISTNAPHPMEKDHFIQWIELFVGPVFLGRAEFTQFTKPDVTFVVKAPSPGHGDYTLRALLRCNLHGVWENTKKIRMKSEK
ncbi:Desulfoferrodoxin ferrous iron-binding region [Methanothermus fervidus DSM 2088]|uniref:Desulfoferrodoxin ferrous iron-binding region n=1 Tax=Methanothermus fervidus (strain ATCC 43054 / DSM 2088 / JCM 10308 / V24 S) TaxID=523846 RepID=E3GWM9_METFV|nr:class II SORL domain-containing protein [Methanothermus fervidus]ADP76843.1 Desulfoferrodoxin ferrous iron-binding region [Methanothermus fervidus DSM 2088]